MILIKPVETNLFIQSTKVVYDNELKNMEGNADIILTNDSGHVTFKS